MKEFWSLLKSIIQTELRSEYGKINLIFGVLLTLFISLIVIPDVLFSYLNPILEKLSGLVFPDLPNWMLFVLAMLVPIFFIVCILVSAFADKRMSS
ncbi:hypothetical protein JW710_02020 [Candidatus Dojkabacteria bacterium]|nr:hypothetical protein [Candidatus Dojkabacteria bacterium]